jgi:N-acetyl-alpha-D-muramate 1-phosphate uridylyltransferase
LQAVILAGGLGTRLKPITDSLPKALTPVLGRPFIDYQVELLKKSGVRDFVICIGYLGEKIEGHLGDGSRLGVKVEYSRDGPELLGPSGALKRAERLLGDSFFVTYGDAYLRAPYGRIMEALLDSDRLGLMVVFRNDGRYGKSDVVVESGMVVRYDKKKSFDGMHWINFGVSALRKDALRAIPEGRVCGEEEFYGTLIKERQLKAFQVEDRFYEIGTAGSLAEFERFMSE